jgi:hypothetical protein
MQDGDHIFPKASQFDDFTTVNICLFHPNFICGHYHFHYHGQFTPNSTGEKMLNRIRTLTFILTGLALALSACGTPAQAVNTNPTLPAVSNGETGGGGEAGGGVEAALVTYSDSTQGFAIGHPGPWTQDVSFTNGVKFVGGDDYMTLELVTPPAGTDAMTYAQSDVSAVSAAFPNFKQLSLAPSTEVKNAIILGFTADGKSAVTGKTFTAYNEIYYMPLADGRIAVLTVVGPESHYDQQGVRDIALTFQLTK